MISDKSAKHALDDSPSCNTAEPLETPTFSPPSTPFPRLLKCLRSCFGLSSQRILHLPPSHLTCKTLVLNLEETLVHCVFSPTPEAAFAVTLPDTGVDMFVLERPGLHSFLTRCSQIFEVVIFTASPSELGAPIIAHIDPTGLVHHQLFKSACTLTEGGYAKDLRGLNRNLADLVIVDVINKQHSPIAYQFQPENALRIRSWFGGREDNELSKLLTVLEELAELDDVRNGIAQLNSVNSSWAQLAAELQAGIDDGSLRSSMVIDEDHLILQLNT